MRTRSLLFAAVIALGLVVPSRSFAGHHLWRLTQVFSNASGSVQFMELFVTDNNEQGVGPFTVTASGHTFSFGTNLPTATTANTWILIATSGFASLPGGIAPDYILPGNFFSTGGGSINYASGIDTWNYGAVPTDGKKSLMRDGSTPNNLAHNFAGQSGSVTVTSSVPVLGTWGLVLLVGALLLLGSGLLRKQQLARVS